MLRIAAKFLLGIFGWKVAGALPPLKKYVLIGAPHTSNWDFPVALLGALAIGLRFKWMAKHSIFKGPLGPILKSIGGIPVNRSVHSSLIERMIELFNERGKFVLGIMPEGTRKKSQYWKPGFYYIAVGAKVPIAFAYMDYSKKRVGIADIILQPTGNLESDMEKINEFFKDKTGKNVEQQGEIKVKTN